MDKEKELSLLLLELQTLLLVLDTESLSLAAQSKKERVAQLLQELDTSLHTEPSGVIAAEDADYMFMSCVAPGSRSRARHPHIASEARNILEIVEDRDDSPPRFPLTEEFQATVAPCGATPPLPARPLPPLGDQSYEEGEPCGPVAPCPTDGLDSDGSLYESYGEEEACAAGGMDSLQALPVPSLTHICGLLWRKQWLGRWSRQLVLIKGQLLLCYKCLADGLPLLEMSLAGARAAYKFKRGRRVEHELKVTGAAHTSLVLGLHTQQQAHDWMKVIEDVSSCGHYRSTPWHCRSAANKGKEPALHKMALRATRSLESHRSVGEMVMSRSSDTHSAGSLRVLVRGCWQMVWCRLDGPLLLMYGGPRGSGALQHSIDLRGCTLRAHQCSLTIGRQDRELALLQAVSLEEKGRWLRLLSAAGRADAEPDPDHAYEDPCLATGAWNGASNGPVSGLMQRRVTTPNAYMDDPFGQVSIQPTPGDGDRDSDRDGDRSPSPPQQRLALPNQQLGGREGTRFAENYQRNTNSGQGARYNTLPSARFLTSWGELERQAPEVERAAARDQSTQTDKKDFKEAMDPLPERKALPRLEEKMRRLEQAVLRAKERVKSGSELNLLSLSKTFKRASCGHSLALFSSSSETAHSEVGIVSPMLRRTASAKCSLRRAPSVLGVERGRVLQKTKEWEMKSSV